MKKVLLLAVLGLGALVSSCEKDYTCECVITTSGTDLFGDPIPTTSTTSSGTVTGKKKEVEEACSEGDISLTIFGTTTESKCTIK